MTKALLIIGAARSGLAAAALARTQGWQVWITDDRRGEEELAADINPLGLHYCEPGRLPAEVSLVVLSPVIKPAHPLVQQALAARVPVESEVDFASRYFQGCVFAITGSNGKTTCTMLAEAVLREAGFDARACGNMGYPFSRLVLEHPECQWAVAELSSYQLEMSAGLRVRAALLLNLSEDHLERHGSMHAYLAAKLRLVGMLEADGALVVNGDDDAIMEGVSHLDCAPLAFSATHTAAIHLDGDTIRFPLAKSEDLLEGQRPKLRGRHNLQNIMAVALGAWQNGVPLDVIRRAVLDFAPVEHRIEPVAVLRGVEWINDSKATNVDSTKHALRCFPDRRVVLMAGGEAKTDDYSEVAVEVADKVRVLVAFGKDGKIIADWFAMHGNGDLQIERCDTMADAIARARDTAAEGDYALLSPMCASFDQFKNFEERGTRFKEYVLRLHEEAQ